MLKNSLPPRLTGDTAKDLARLWDYLYKLAEELGIKSEVTPGLTTEDIDNAGYLTGDKGILPIAKGGTNANSKAAASKNLIYAGNWAGIINNTAQNISREALTYGYYDSSLAVSTYKPTSWGFALSIGNNAADWHQIWMEQSNNGGGLFHRGGNANVVPTNVGWTRILDATHMKRADVTFGSDGIGTMTCSGVKTTSAIIAMRNSSHTSGASNIYPIAEAWCETAGTVKMMLSNPMAGTFPVTVFWSK